MLIFDVIIYKSSLLNNNDIFCNFEISWYINIIIVDLSFVDFWEYVGTMFNYLMLTNQLFRNTFT